MNLEERAKTCEECLGWLDVCEAECCKAFTLELPNHFDRTILVKGKTISVKTPCGPNKSWYYKLHRCNVGRGIIFIKLDDFKIEGNKLTVFKRCKLLTEDNKCRNHPDKKPRLCKELTLENVGLKRIQMTQNCLFKFKGKISIVEG